MLAGHIAPGEKLDVNALADMVSASITPIRDALQRLAGEGLILSRSDGFAMPLITEPGLRQLYSWHGELSELSIRQTGLAEPDVAGSQDDGADIVSATQAFFIKHAALSGNREHRVAMTSAGERLHAVRVHEALYLTGLEAELSALELVCSQSSPRAVRRGLRAYHKRRFEIIPKLVQKLYGGASHAGR